MTLRTARRGARAGEQFWGCTDFPRCRAIVNLDGEPKEKPVDPVGTRTPAVSWVDGTLDRTGYTCSYINAGGSLRCVDLDASGWSHLAKTWMAVPDGPGASQSFRETLDHMRKIVQRGSAPPIDPSAERALIDCMGFADEIRESPLPGDLAFSIKTGLTEEDVRRAAGLDCDSPFSPDQEIEFDSEEERLFLGRWVTENLGANAGRWFIPQASLDGLVAGLDESGAQRRVDFLVVTPWLDPFVVEIDGLQHESSAEVDSERDRLLERIGLEVVRISTAEVRGASGPGGHRLKELWRDGPSMSMDEVEMAWVPTLTHRAVLGILAGFEAGLAGESCSIAIEDPSELLRDMIPPYLTTLVAIDQLWGDGSVPRDILLTVNDDLGRLTWDDKLQLSVDRPGGEHPVDFRVALEPCSSPTDPIRRVDDVPTVVVRSAFLPVRLASSSLERTKRNALRSEGEVVKNALTVLLRATFAKESFREGQLDALFEVLAGRDCAVLLPTGAGKSLIYQLAGLCLPGRTLVVDPLVSLMEDQAESLRNNGIDRIALISGFETQRGNRDALHREVASGEALFTFVSPERLQQQSFRSKLRSLSQVAPVNLCVVDEAHCISEWGHDFRTSYLHLGRILRSTCRRLDGSAPPVLALTGTASRAVLRDVLMELSIDRDSERAVVRPRTFDRPELHYQVMMASPEEAEAVLTGALRALPGRAGVPPSDFFRDRGQKTQSGIVFCPHVDGQFGVEGVANAVASVTGSRPAIYSGRAPRLWGGGSWEIEKRRQAGAFKANTSPLLVSTKAFGMGIDKPNVRYIIHYGIPGSIESYYQEVGRAGRDRTDATCVLVLVVFDENRNRGLLSEDADLEETRERSNARRRESDDINRQLYFHLQSFQGIAEELEHIEEFVDRAELGTRQVLEVPMGDRDQKMSLERTIYRMVILGVVKDYTVEWGSKRFDVTMSDCSGADVVDGLLDYIGQSAPGRVETVRESLPDPAESTLEEVVLECSRFLIEFIYDTIERSRRRSLREMWLAALDNTGKPDAGFRQRILDYLSQGDVAPVLERLAEQDTLSFDEWIKPLEKITPGPDAGELRGNAARLLASFPDHPGMLLARAWAEARDPKGDLREYKSNLRSALESAQSRYGLAATDFGPLARWLTTATQTRSGTRAATYEAFDEAAVRPPEIADLLDRALSEQRPEPGLVALALRHKLERGAAVMDEAIERDRALSLGTANHEQ